MADGQWPLAIAVDALGGDDAPGAVVAGAVRAAQAGHHVILVGPAAGIRSLIAKAGATGLSNLSVEEAPDGVAMDESPVAALRRKPRASIRVACDLVASGRASGVYSAGHTGAALVAAHAAFGMMPGVERPALAVTVPTRAGRSVLLDAGANADCRASHLAQFGLMGSVYASVALGIAEPGVGLLSVGEEAGKGNELVKDAHVALTKMPVQFVGNIDAAQWFHGIADVVVTDGFTGNIALKVGEAVVELVAKSLGAVNAGSTSDALGNLSYAKEGGAPLIGVNGLMVVGHGRSTADAIASGIALTATLAERRVVAKVAEAVQRVLK
ncbi:MAG: phosphate acyltransferase PlsX [Acidobacteria bacterium]|nr:MAG: phosphate acyltransferase PlsX [Acidobacteriota bacterium]